MTHGRSAASSVRIDTRCRMASLRTSATISVLRVPNPIGRTGRIDEPRAGRKGRGFGPASPPIRRGTTKASAPNGNGNNVGLDVRAVEGGRADEGPRGAYANHETPVMFPIVSC